MLTTYLKIHHQFVSKNKMLINSKSLSIDKEKKHILFHPTPGYIAMYIVIYSHTKTHTFKFDTQL